MLALLPYMLEHFKEPDEFCKTCAKNFVQVVSVLCLKFLSKCSLFLRLIGVSQVFVCRFTGSRIN